MKKPRKPRSKIIGMTSEYAPMKWTIEQIDLWTAVSLRDWLNQAIAYLEARKKSK